MSSWRNSYSSPSSQQQQQLQQQTIQATSFSPQPQFGMADGAPTNTNVENGPRAKCDQVVFEAIAKAAEIVVGSRCWIDPMVPMADNTNSSSSSRRFNLLVPEVHGVRTILQRWKRALHVPLRLDVYYQHTDSRRELLERWCLEYAPKPSHAGFGASHNTNPIVQLRHVCKQIVIWLRSLYCLSRMLPAQALRRQNSNNSAIGFSIYVVSEGNDDVSGLVSSQGFSAQQQPHSVWTPYGELGWKVFYAPKQVVQRLIPEKSPYTTTSSARPIVMTSARQGPPLSQQQQQPNSYHPTRDWNRRESDTSAMPAPGSVVGNVAQSAPHHASGRMYMRSQSDISEAQRHAMAIASSPVIGAMQPSKQKNLLVGRDTLQHSETQKRVAVSPKLKSMAAPPTDSTAVPPAKNRSALSLAMMMAGDQQEDSKGGDTSGVVNQQALAANEAAEKRRMALHHAPPQLSQSPNVRRSPLATAGEYGYAYNSLIPPLRSQQKGGGNDGSDGGYGSSAQGGMHASPQFASSTPLGSTPPGYLLGGPTPPAVVPNLSTLIPPRGTVTPPFTRPMGFVKEAPRQDSLLPPSVVSDIHDQSLLSQQEQSHNDGNKLARTPMTSLDLLRSSPFQQPVYASMLGGMSGHATEPYMSFGSAINHGQSMEMLGAVGSTASMGPRLQSDDHEDMPFAVETPEESVTQSQPGESTSAIGSFTSSTMMRDMNHPPKRLQMFDSGLVAGASSSGPSTSTHDPIDSLSEQLAEFKSFGESLVVSAPASDGTGSSSVYPQPISLHH
eukprot:Nitzschia sp. Nitz4//scaffold12_size214221//32111//34528//NITZ4_001483-RA/size214221-augustus-gene-0.4-mRNA-1//1//CDS//3329534969//7233//frame0